MSVLKLVLAYDGTGFRGWARQPGKRTVQGVLERALERMLGEFPRLSVAGRTDAGVHARGQVVSLEWEDPERLQRGLNGMLAPEVVVRRATRAPDGFDARRSARARVYRYRVSLAPIPDPFTARYVWHRPAPLALAPMRRAARLLEGEHDFASFCRAPRRGGTVRRLERLAIRREGDLLELGVRANALCHQMVRSLVGTLLEVGEGRKEAGSMTEVLEARSRRAAGHVAPPHGLTLERVLYRP
ncbi:MAG TPA: tRNA pseudouridine(38-40) synthase TruA [Actinomycetota bacterium]